MLKKILIVFSIVFIILSYLKLSNANMVVNPSFENGSEEPDDWTPIGEGYYLCSWDNTNARTGSHSVKIEFPGQEVGESPRWMSFLIPYDDTKDYLLEVYYLWDAPKNTNDDGHLGLLFFDSEGYPLINGSSGFSKGIFNNYPGWSHASFKVSDIKTYPNMEQALKNTYYISVSLFFDSYEYGGFFF